MSQDPAPRRRRLTRAESQARTRAELLDAAAEVIAERGLAGASIEEIAERAGYSTGALYSNFANKEELFLELMAARGPTAGQPPVATVARTLDERLAAGADPFDLATEIFVAAADGDRSFAPLQAEFWLYAVRHPEAMNVIAGRLAGQVDALEGFVARLLARSSIVTETSTRDVTTIVVGLFHGLTRQRRVDPSSVSEDLFATALRWLLTGLQTQQPLVNGRRKRSRRGA